MPAASIAISVGIDSAKPRVLERPEGVIFVTFAEPWLAV